LRFTVSKILERYKSVHSCDNSHSHIETIQTNHIPGISGLDLAQLSCYYRQPSMRLGKRTAWHLEGALSSVDNATLKSSFRPDFPNLTGG